ncbi:MAG: amidohydrolase family protein [Gemmatimonadota bacterium]
MVSLLVTVGCIAWMTLPSPPSGLPSAAADHHLHMQGPAATAALERIASRNLMLRAMSMLKPSAFRERSGADALRLLDAAGIRHGVLLSEAYRLSSPMVKWDKDVDIPRLTREENAFNVTAARGSGGRLVAFVGINPFSANALDELHFWTGKSGVAGAKLHLANSGFEPGSPKMVATLAGFVDEARIANMPLVIHVRHASDYTKRDAEIFIEQVLSHAGDLPVQIAHVGGWGGLDEATLNALQAYREAIARHAAGTHNLRFDLAVVVLWPRTNKHRLDRLAGLMREIGLDRFPMGSDWPARATPGDYNKLLEAQLPLTRAEWIEVLGNGAPPGLEPRSGPAASWRCCSPRGR